MITKYAKAKVNLTLDILGKRDDGYHEVEMIMQSIDLADIVTLEDAEDIIVETDLAELADDRTNLAYRAAELLRDTYGEGRGAHIRIEKKIPLAAGLAGGSSDAAAVLLGLNELWKLGLDIDKLTALGARLGSDVPFCMIGGTMLAKGRGEVLARVPSLGAYPLVLVKPPLGVSTAAAYGGYRAENVETHPTADRMIRAIESGNITRVYEAMGNVLETVTIP
ncbi:MAG: 4-(cytidine 5'-diphospho)-2-C-methyl-D-erythritol kinase, partial [Selenomonadales bacterium]|nr:4-(cytidine 5'-diphospho)-2-C-methyl-D-erythritol kinase [Selenomonadales bacterium]